jgi:hypothetical protein
MSENDCKCFNRPSDRHPDCPQHSKKPVASPQATRPDEQTFNFLGLDDADFPERAAQPAAGTTPTLNELLESARRHVMTDEEKEAQRQSWVRGEMALSESERGMTSPFPPKSEGTTPQAERSGGPLCDNCGKAAKQHYCWADSNPCGVSTYHPSEARAVAPVETPDEDLT